MKTPLFLALVACILLTRPAHAAGGRGPALPANPALPTIWLIGDSTMRNGQDDGQNKGDAGQWPGVRDSLKKGDYVIMQFGHNDNNGVFTGAGGYRASLNGSGDETQEVTNQRGQPETAHTYGWYLKQYVDEARAKGATPVVCSLIPRKLWQDDGRIVRSNDKYFNYPTWAAEVAKAKDTPFINLNELIARQYDVLGHDAVMKLFPDPVTSANGTVTDEHTHTNMAGAKLNAATVVAGLKAIKDSPFVAFLSEAGRAVAPAADLSQPAPPPKGKPEPPKS